jgi:hypothetical protein
VGWLVGSLCILEEVVSETGGSGRRTRVGHTAPIIPSVIIPSMVKKSDH